MTSIGPFPLAVGLIAVGLIVAIVIARRRADAGERRRAVALLLDTLGVGVLGARIGFIVQWWPQYAAEPWSMLRFGDGGYTAWAGLLCAAVFVLWRLRRRPLLQRPVAAALAGGMATWGVLTIMLWLLQGTPMPLPELTLRSLDGRPVALQQYAGRPTVINLWASWCPPCRREMPALLEAQRLRRDIEFVFVNQGEPMADVRGFLDGQPLPADAVLLDNHSDLARAVGSRGLPTTLFFDARGQLVDTHVGELTRASLADRLRRFERQ